jgi:hypothetical protein
MAARYTANHDYFAEIDTEEKAYFLGLLFADGSVQAEGKSWRIRLTLQRQDQDVVERLKQAISYSGPLRGPAKYVTLQVSSRAMGGDLVRHGCVPRKSLVLKYPVIDERWTWPFIRGYFDGDGSLSISGRQATWSMCGTREFLSVVRDHLASLSVHGTLFPVKGKRHHTLSVRGNRQVVRVVEAMYDDASVSMPRKKEKADDVIRLRWSMRPMRAREWYDDAGIIASYLAGDSVVEIEENHHVSNKTMYAVLDRHGIERRQKRKVCHR